MRLLLSAMILTKLLAQALSLVGNRNWELLDQKAHPEASKAHPMAIPKVDAKILFRLIPSCLWSVFMVNYHSFPGHSWPLCVKMKQKKLQQGQLKVTITQIRGICPNFVMDHFTGQTCNISGCNGKINDKAIVIGTGLTLWTDPGTGQKHLLQVNQDLDMCHILDHTLANTDQCRSFGISWCDDAWDPNQSFGI